MAASMMRLLALAAVASGALQSHRVGGPKFVSTPRRSAAFLGASPQCCRRLGKRFCRRSTTTVSMMEEIEADIVIVGGGPAGCTCALYSARADHKVVILDKNPTVGALAVTSHIANYPGVDKSMSGTALLDLMRQQAIDYGTDYRRAQVFFVDSGSSSTEGDSKDAHKQYNKIVSTPDAIYKARALVLATGAMGREPSFKGEGEFLGQGVSYCATCDGAFYRDAEVAVVGVNQEAIEEAQFLTKFASTVHWITTKDPSEDDEHAQELLAHPSVKHWSRTGMLSVEGDDSGVTGVTVKRKGADSSELLPVAGCFIYVAGSKPITDFLQDKSVRMQEDGGVWVDDEMATSVDGVFAIGDIRNTPFKQVVVAASDGCIAAMAIDKYLKGRKKIRVDWIHE